jgi:DNA replication protein DnaC
METSAAEAVKKIVEEQAAIVFERQKKPEMTLLMCRVGLRHVACSFESYKGGEAVKQSCKDFISGKETDLFIGGPTGRGKTHLAVATMREFAKQFKINGWADGKFTTVPDLLMQIRDSFKDGAKVTEAEVVKEYSSVPYLVLDDLGAEKTTEWSISTLYLIIDRRIRDMRQTIYTSNLTLDEIERQFSPRIASRLSASKVVMFGKNSEDYRRKRA